MRMPPNLKKAHHLKMSVGYDRSIRKKVSLPVEQSTFSHAYGQMLASYNLTILRA